MIRDNEYAVVTIKMNAEDYNWFIWALNELEKDHSRITDLEFVYNKMKDLLL